MLLSTPVGQGLLKFGVAIVQDGYSENVRESLKPVHRVNQPQILLAGVAVPSETASRLIADVYGWWESKMDMEKRFGSPRSLYTMIARTIGGV